MVRPLLPHYRHGNRARYTDRGLQAGSFADRYDIALCTVDDGVQLALPGLKRLLLFSGVGIVVVNMPDTLFLLGDVILKAAKRLPPNKQMAYGNEP